MKNINKISESRIYVCHTYYHVLVAVLKELNLPDSKVGKATILLSKMSNDFETIGDRLEESGLFQEVIEFDEKRDTFFPELSELKKDKGNIISNMWSRIKFTRELARLEAKYVPVDFRLYEDIYVFCDGDPIGIYLNQNRIRYHAVEDGLDTLKPYIHAKYDNRTHFNLKKFFSMNLNLIFMCDGYSKYCIDMEVNDISCLDDDFYKYKEVPRKKLIESLSAEKRQKLIRIFVKDINELEEFAKKKTEDGVLILTEPLCTLDVRERLFKDLTEQYKKEGTIYIKPHPRDNLNYKEVFPDYWVFDRTIPMEILGLFKEIHFKKIVSVYTQLGLVDFVDEKVMLGNDFMDKYEDPEIHRKAEKLKDFSK